MKGNIRLKIIIGLNKMGKGLCRAKEGKMGVRGPRTRQTELTDGRIGEHPDSWTAPIFININTRVNTFLKTFFQCISH